MTISDNHLDKKHIEFSSINALPDHARVWIYASNRPFTESEKAILTHQINDFVEEWAAHGRDLQAVGTVLYNQFIVLAVNEQQAGASGCSIDKSVKFMQFVENQYFIQLFDRLNFAFLNDHNQVKMMRSEDFKKAYTDNIISDDTLVFDNLVKTVADLRNAWLKPLKTSWHKRFV